MSCSSNGMFGCMSNTQDMLPTCGVKLHKTLLQKLLVIEFTACQSHFLNAN